MSRWAALAVVAALGCAHAKVATDTPPAPPAAEAAPKPAPRPARPEPGAPPLFDSPGASLAPHGIEMLQGRLVANGDLARTDADGTLGDPTKHALEAFQRRRNLPATGVPDDTTVQALGLDPAKVFRRAP